MSRRWIWPVLVAAGFVLGGMSHWSGGTAAEPPPTAAADPDNTTDSRDSDTLHELKTISSQLKEINTLLHTGTIKVIVVLNPDEKKL